MKLLPTTNHQFGGVLTRSRDGYLLSRYIAVVTNCGEGIAVAQSLSSSWRCPVVRGCLRSTDREALVDAADGGVGVLVTPYCICN